MGNWGMVDSIWRYPLKSAQGEAIPRVFIGTGGPAGDRPGPASAPTGSS